MFVCFEGIDGAGKSTQARMLYQLLHDAGQAVELVADPGTTQIGTAIRQILLQNDGPISPMAQMLLFSAARAELASYITEKLAAGVTVICDRWLLSTLVYQGEINGIKPDLILSIFRGTSFVVPDLCVLLDLDPASAEPRMGKPRDRYERRNTEDRQRMRAAYKRYMIDECPLLVGKRLAIVNAELPPNSVHSDVYRLYRNAARLHPAPVNV